MSLKIHNVRLGRACNSSSSHSIILLKNQADKPNQDNYNGPEFGWDNFTLTTKSSKNMYGAVSILSCLSKLFGAGTAREITKQLTGIEFANDDYAYIDHQSEIIIPTDINGNPIQQFINDYLEYLKRDDVVVLGGNDNSDGHELSNLEGERKLHGLAETNFTGRYDKKYQFYTLMRDSGHKYRLSFNQPTGWEPTKSQYPELVDLKITNYCDIGCTWCYQDSTLKGKHASLESIKQVIDVLAKMEVLEVALGGGETTEHPDFVEIIKYIHSKGITPNFTTQSFKWMSNPNIVKAVDEYVGAFAFSIRNQDAAVKLMAALSQIPSTGASATAQYVMGTMDEKEFKATSEILYKHTTGRRISYITLLGYKNVGRGNKFAPLPYDKWGQWIKDIAASGIYINWSIDTTLAASSLAQLDELEVPKWCYAVDEGKFSMYIDNVDMKCGPSSYCENDQYIKIDQSNIFKGIEDAYALF